MSNVLLRGSRMYIRVPESPTTKRRRRIATLITCDPADQKSLGRATTQAIKLLARIEDLTTSATPAWEVVQALHAGEMTLSELNQWLLAGGVDQARRQLVELHRARIADHELLPLVEKWPATPPGTENLPSQATIINRKQRVRDCMRQLKSLGRLRADLVQEHLEKLTKNMETRRTYARDIRMFCEWLVDGGLIAENPVRFGRLKFARGKKQKRARAYRFQLLVTVWKNMPVGPLQDAVGFMMATGVEPGLVAGVGSEDVQAEEGVVWIEGTKNENRARMVTVDAWFCPRLVQLKKQRPQMPLMPVSRFAIADALREVRKRLSEDPALAEQLQGLTPYCLRHSWAARKAKAGMDRQDIAHQLGHANVRMVNELYANVLAPTSKEEVAKRHLVTSEERAAEQHNGAPHTATASDQDTDIDEPDRSQRDAAE